MVRFTSSDDSIDQIAFDPLSINTVPSIRAPMEDFFDKPSILESSLSIVEDGIESPPPYDFGAPVEISNARRKYNIQPREDEGREKLPPYSCEISLENMFFKKAEFERAVHKAADRSWYRVYVTLQGTALTLHKYKPPGLLSSWLSENGRSDGDAAVSEKKGKLLKSYNLQHADVGIAADYYKKRYVIRVRAETDQFLLSCYKIETFLQWLQSLFAAIDIAPPLDSRPLPRDRSTPRARWRRTSCSTSATELDRNPILVREQYEIMRRRYPNLVDGPISAGIRGPGTQAPIVSTQSPAPDPLTSAVHNRALSYAAIPTLSGISQPARVRAQSTIIPPTTIKSDINPETGKWRPEHHWSAMYDMIYAKRCMAILLSRSPRKTDLVIMKGKQWVVDWATGVLTRCEPPEYGDIVVEKGSSRDGIWHTVANINAGRVP